jgi:uncharacterized protein (TIGR03435 family)
VFAKTLLLFAWCCLFLAPSAPGQLVPAIGSPAATTNNIAVDPPRLAVASIKQVAPDDRDAMMMGFSEDGASFRSVAVAWIVQLSLSGQPSLWNQEDDLIVGLPGWTKTERYDIQAKVDEDDVPKWKELSPSQRWLAVQPLLVTRFHLQFHHETRDRPAYSLVVAKKGPKLHKALPAEASADGAKSPSDTAGDNESTVTPGKIVLKGSSLAALAKLLSSQGLSHPVIDKTGLTDIYDITLRWSLDDTGSSDSSLPSLFTALQEQLGLKLQFNKNPVDVIVIDRFEKPSAN